MEGSLVAYKVFTNGSTLQASELNENLMQQSIAVFSNAAARTAAITSPVEGQMTYLEDTNQYASWDGSTWSSPFGLTLVKSITVGTAVSSVTLTDVFSSEFDNYRIEISGITANTNAGLSMQLGSATSLYFAAAGLVYYDGTSGNSSQTSGSSVSLGALAATNGGGGMSLDIYNPFLTQRTGFTGQSISFRADTNGFVRNYGGFQNSDTSFTAVTFSVSGATLTGGKITVYGYRKA
jgi:hypothetical protein